MTHFRSLRPARLTVNYLNTELQLSEPKLHLKHNFKAKAISFHFAERY